MKVIVVPKWLMPFGYGLTLYSLVLIREDGDYKYLLSMRVNTWKTERQIDELFILGATL